MQSWRGEFLFVEHIKEKSCSTPIKLVGLSTFLCLSWKTLLRSKTLAVRVRSDQIKSWSKEQTRATGALKSPGHIHQRFTCMTLTSRKKTQRSEMINETAMCVKTDINQELDVLMIQVNVLKSRWNHNWLYWRSSCTLPLLLWTIWDDENNFLFFFFVFLWPHKSLLAQIW